MKYIEKNIKANTSDLYTISIPSGILPGNTSFLIRTSVVFEVITSAKFVDKIGLTLQAGGEYRQDVENPGCFYRIVDNPNESPAHRVADIPQCRAITDKDGTLKLTLTIQLWGGTNMWADVRGNYTLRMLFEEYTPTII